MRQGAAAATKVAPERSAKAAHLRYVSDGRPGYARRRAGAKGFAYVDAKGRRIRSAAVLERIRRIVVPPAWTRVWICPLPNGHIQATGLDARGRKQYRYHAQWRLVRDSTKYSRMQAFGAALPRMRGRVSRDIRRPGLPREKVLAAVVRLLEATHIRVGNEEYAKENKSFGLTTLRDRHADVTGSTIEFQFKGKSGKSHTIDLRDRFLADIVKKCQELPGQELPGQELLQYRDPDGRVKDIDSADVNEYVKEMTGRDFTAKDFRTWAGTALAAVELRAMLPFTSKIQAKKNVVSAVDEVAAHLGNTRAVCKKAYIHPQVIESYLAGRLDGDLARPVRVDGGLTRGEAAVLGLLKRRGASLHKA